MDCSHRDRATNHSHREPTGNAKWKYGMVLALVASLVGCGGASDSEVTKPDGSTGTGGSGGGTGGAGGTAGTGGSGSGGGGTAGTGGAGGAAGSGGVSGGCPTQTSVTLALHIVMDVTWPATSATVAGMGKVHIWNRAKLNASGTALTGETWSCGTGLPEFSLNFAGQVVTGGMKVLVDVPHAVWDAPSIPKSDTMGTISGWNVGSSIDIKPTVSLVGLTMSDPMAAWPMSYTGLMAVDADSDGKLGFTAIPKQGGGYVAPPTALGVLGSAPQADKVYLASRTIVALNGKFTSCMEQSGTADVSFFNSHIVGCHIKGGGECTPAQVDFVDQSRTDYKVTSATFKAKQVAAGASCADVRAALPM